MDKFSREKFGYSVDEVEQYLERQRWDNDEKIKALNEKILELKQENYELKNQLTQHKSIDEKVANELSVAEEKAQKIIDSAKTVYELEIRRMQLLYRRWDNVLKDLTDGLSKFVPESEINSVTQDFNKALSMTLETLSVHNDKDKLYAKSVLTRMGGGKKIKTTNEFIKRGSPNKTFITTETITVTNESSAEKFLNGQGVVIPAAMGKLGKDVLNIPPAEAYENKKEGEFSLEDALVPKESLEEIMKAFSLDE